MNKDYDVIVVGAGHAGCEAAASAANLGSRVLLITMDMNKIAQMSCNPAMGGIAKGQIVREIDALGGYSGLVTDRSMLQFRMLNKSKGPAMWSPRAQCDRTIFSLNWRERLEKTPNLDFWQDTVKEIIVENDKVIGVKTKLGIIIKSKTVILTNGTFLNGLMHIGKVQIKGGRASEPGVSGLSQQLFGLGFTTGRMKTGTPPRLDGRSIDFEKLQEQKGDEDVVPFSYLNESVDMKKGLSCYIAHTSQEVHDILKTGFDDSPMFDGTIKSVGPRYCPSIESKLITFADKTQHQLFAEPEGWDTVEYYLNGFSSSLAWEVQLEALRKIVGFEKVIAFRPGYAIEYDYFDPMQLYHSMETKLVKNLYFAGQINGTTGYEEAGAQGIIAGINAHLKINEKEEFVLNRDQAYIGVLIDDLVTKGVDEPYRMFTSRAEYRILLRQDNADERLSALSNNLGLAGDDRMKILDYKTGKKGKLVEYFAKRSVKPQEINDSLSTWGTSPIKQTIKLKDIIARPQVKLRSLVPVLEDLEILLSDIEIRESEIVEAAEIEMKYHGYIEREKAMAEKITRLEELKIPEWINYHELKSLTYEAREKLSKVKPSNIAQASRIPGVSPADVNVLLIKLGR
ncbi:MAG: tRNA uridine-5-carboxymethylaminomethyl(34) synthesis enzyme MnmG [Bacteroidetes bacterium]|jgi:tRNA uridine 5-carboxymethylaminomethyl modification enzyme|nr:tRNA uridine-5-carboxymethylaminomethyl(34) synthesis enzyme MnmG [Bacteroidota bacterium]MBT4398401.1 tRNA uridine-5-carboxymethylaminomethyl(34) synthesis enzyme MnmG [Bacteroidota bacterium]MBT4411823.1 tRNA uridine-5-carboxymethylaminomethyl(34) synthesis enzyme MnmG [Bacteroidota bacterium]MBT7094338.1 tRNA uridine-5-carboxymethylaminomethyl(34) synthesis enzyme MnmG [Bacteroidota bacterium]MBT7462751.1 tRNA uridine-5-carboxymethylaminomethyl(34) synthesis enzyme MnmG [Bacteroidota bact